MNPALLIALPTGLTIGGVQTWAARLANGLAARGRTVGLILHLPTGPTLDAPLDPRVQIFNISSAPPLDNADGNLAPFLSQYDRAIRTLAAQTNAPVICAPCHLGDCYGLFASLAGPHTRIVGWCHLAIPYDLRILEYYEPILSAFVPVSNHLEATLKSRLPGRAADVVNIACGVELPLASHIRHPTSAIRLIYLGRFDDAVKRVSTLPLLCDELARRGIPHHITAVGDGPVTLEPRPTLTTIKGVSPARAAQLLREHDILILPSKVEGLSVSMLEAMAAGCVPIVTRTESGAAQVITGEDRSPNGLIVDAAPDAPFQEIAATLADAITAALPNLPAMSAAATQTIRDDYSLDLHLDRVERLMLRAAQSPTRAWPKDRPAAFTSSAAHGSGTVPPNGAARLRQVLENLEGRRIAIHGTGRHTIELSPILAAFKDRIVAFTDDDPARRTQTLQGLPILAPTSASRAGITDVVISSWINQDQIWNARDVYERQQVRVHRLYAA